MTRPPPRSTLFPYTPLFRSFFGMAGIHQQSQRGPGGGNGLVHFHGMPVSSASLNVAMKKMVGDGIQHGAGRLCARRVVEENEIVFIQKGRKLGANLGNWELRHSIK